MRFRARAWGLVALCLAMAWPDTSQAAPPVRGADYVAEAPGVERPLYLRVSADGRRLTRYLLGSRMSCSDGKHRQFFLNHVGEKRFGITADGRFDFTSSGRYSDGKLRGSRSIRFVGSFAGDQATITAEHTLTGAVRCSSVTPLTFNRVGSAGAPAADGLMTTGRYVFDRRGSGSLIRVSTVRTVGPARTVEGLRVAWTAPRCSSGRRSYRAAIPYVPLLLDRRAALSLTETYNGKVGGGLRGRDRVTLKLRFRRQGSRHVLDGTLKARTRLYRRGKQVDTCRFSQRFRSVARP